MDIIDQENMYPSKRRKITLPDKALDVPYFAIAQQCLPISSLSLDCKALDQGSSSRRQVSIKSFSVVDAYVHIQLTGHWQKSAFSVQTSSNASTTTFLQHCTSLEPIIKVQKDPHIAFLACYDAVLCLDQQPHLELRILWHDASNPRDKVHPKLREIFNYYVFPGTDVTLLRAPVSWDVQEFYQHVHVPASNAANNAELKIDLLHCDLYPFQRQAVRWLLAREGVAVSPSGQVVVDSTYDSQQPLLSTFEPRQDTHGNTYYASLALSVACSSHDAIRKRYGGIRGGLLGEAMGLGKTVEMIALMSLHTMSQSPIQHIEVKSLKPSAATLIITPPAIIEQWKQEIQMHAPSFRVYHYEGAKTSSKQGLEAAIETLTSCDVVLTTYGVLSKELHYVAEKPDRSLRARPRVESPKSPLNQVLWWRVCLDEAQMIETGVSAAATVARLIPRVNAWAVTGTPVKQSHKDIFGLMLFLRYEPWGNTYRLWEYLVNHHRPLFQALMGEIAIRHSKEIVRDELRLPPQTRHTITVSFSSIEQAHYSQLFYDMYLDCGLDRDGAPQDDDWNPDHPKTIEKMRMWLTRLRQTCVHPEVGGRNRRALGRHSTSGPLRTVQQVLDVMMDQNESMLRLEQRNMLVAKIRQGQMMENAKDKDAAMNMYRGAHEIACTFVDECRQGLEAELAAQQLLEQRKDQNEDSNDEEEEDAQHLTARQRLRSALEVKHICVFFVANIYFQMKSDEADVKLGNEEFASLEEQETKAYEEAKKIRGELLKEAARKANHQIAKLRVSDNRQDLSKIPEMELDRDDYSGIESRKIFEKLFHFCHAMNLQANQLQELRDKMMKFLQQALIDEDEGIELQGDEYENSTKHQDEMYAYMEALRALYADRNDAVSGQENLLIRSEMKGFLRAAKDGEGPAPELMIELLAKREQRRIKIDTQGSLRGIVAEIRALVSALDFQEASGSARARAELHLASEMLRKANSLMSVQWKSITGLEQEVAYFRNSMNARLEYYKALQKISDTVAPYREEDIGKPLDERQYQTFVKDESVARNRCSTFQAKQRYLMHLKSESAVDSTPRICTICQSEFEIGAITSCGHVFCKEDLHLWYSAHGNCPVCKRRLRTADFFDVTYKPAEMVVQAEAVPGPEALQNPADRLLSNSIYSDIGEKQLNQIKNIEISGASFGSKVDTICRHLHWLREQDPGSKTIIFSQFREVLGVLGRAFKQNNISFARCDDRTGTSDFKANPAIECFLLHAKAHSAGLNLVVASHVILCEPLINTAIELQAIARVHRIGQHRTTTVWMYLIADTVEEAIYDISVQRRLAHMTSRDENLGSGTSSPRLLHESAIDAANSKELQALDLSKALAPGKNGGEMVGPGDLWPCLFGSKNHISRGASRVDDMADNAPADSAMGQFLRFEAAERRRM